MDILRLFQIEFYKLRYNRNVIVLFVVYTFLMLFVPVLLDGRIKISGVDIYSSIKDLFEFPAVWHFTAYAAQWAKIFLLLIVVFMVSSEYTYRTLKQNLIDGLSKKEFVFSKFIMVVAICLFSTFLVFIDALNLGFTHTSDISLEQFFTDTVYLLAYFIRILTFFSLGMFFAILFKRAIFSIAGIFVWWIVEQLILHLFFRSYEFKVYIYQVLPLQAMSNLIEEPFTRFKPALAMATGRGDVDYSVQWTGVLICCIWTALFVGGSCYLLKKRDL